MHYPGLINSIYFYMFLGGGGSFPKYLKGFQDFSHGETADFFGALTWWEADVGLLFSIHGLSLSLSPQLSRGLTISHLVCIMRLLSLWPHHSHA